MQNRIEVFEQMLAADPSNTMVMFGLAKEYEKLGDHREVIALLENYLAKADDEGNAYGVLANAYYRPGDREKAIETYQERHRRLDGPRPSVDGERVQDDAGPRLRRLDHASPLHPLCRRPAPSTDFYSSSSDQPSSTCRE